MGPVDWLPNYISYPLYWIYLDQALIAGSFAILAAFITVRAIRDQISQQNALEEDRLKRRSRALRAALPSALSEYAKYTDNCLARIHELRKFLDEGGDFVAVDVPSYPNSAASKLSSTIECCHLEDAKKLAGILAWGQIYESRFNRLLQRSTDAARSISELDIVQLFYDTLCLRKLVDRAYEYGRGRESHIGDICSIDEAISTLHVSFKVTIDALDAKVRRQWPPDFHDYAEELQEW
ncbi:hypothetical protein ACQKH5_14825 [Hyphomonas sp. NPDC076900]|uniref:hypothetical protein n=1 Tax=unclassified Hyphomonas TaxID=2630699 RepID=UPI003D0578D0